MGNICPTCQREVEGDVAICPRDGTPLGTVVMDRLLGVALGGRYLLRECVGTRGIFRIYGGEAQGSERAVLVTLTEREVKEEVVATFRELAEGLTRIDHPHCTRILDFGLTSDKILYLVEEGDVWHLLSHDLETKGRLPVSTALDLGVQLLEGLDHLHGEGVVHGRLSPAALRLSFDQEGSLVLQIPSSDVPCRAVDPDGDPTARRYFPGDDVGGPSSDIQAAALILLQMLTGELPRGGGWSQPRLEAVDLEPEALESLRSVVARGLGQEGEGFRTAGEMLRELQTLTGHSRFGRYQLLRQIGQGGMGEIYLARAEGIEGMDLDRLCVIKTIQTSLASDPTFVERFLSEARVLASLSHGNIVPVYDVGKVGTTFYIAMQYVAGKDVRMILTRAAEVGKRLPVPLALFIARELANGLAYSHRAKVQGRQGLVHRDVSPHNVLVSYEGEVRLIDFGLVQGATRDPTIERGVVMGKVCYMSPEQALAQPLDRRTDIYSAGLVLFELLTGEPFFNQPTVEEVMVQVGAPALHPPSARADGIFAEVDRICLRAMAVDREQRYSSAAELRDDLSAELARIAPRTNPEEVGAFVRDLFQSEQVAEHRALSDLSVTLPPLGQDETSGVDPGQAVSLLRATPAPIQLTDSSASIEKLGLEPRPARMVDITVQVQHPDIPARGLLIGAAAVLVLVAAGLLLATSWIRSGRRQAMPKLALVTKQDVGPAVVIPADDMGPETPAAAPDGGGPDRPTLKLRPRRVRKTKRPTHRSRTCRLVVVGPRNADVVVNGQRMGRLPLDGVLTLPAGLLHVVVRRGSAIPFRKTIECQAGEGYRVTARMRSE